VFDKQTVRACAAQTQRFNFSLQRPQTPGAPRYPRIPVIQHGHMRDHPRSRPVDAETAHSTNPGMAMSQKRQPLWWPACDPGKRRIADSRPAWAPWRDPPVPPPKEKETPECSRNPQGAPRESREPGAQPAALPVRSGPAGHEIWGGGDPGTRRAPQGARVTGDLRVAFRAGPCDRCSPLAMAEGHLWELSGLGTEGGRRDGATLLRRARPARH
jgi:hypothetical protein